MLKYIHNIILKSNYIIQMVVGVTRIVGWLRRLSKERHLQVAEHGVVAERAEEERRNIYRLGRGRWWQARLPGGHKKKGNKDRQKIENSKNVMYPNGGEGPHSKKNIEKIENFVIKNVASEDRGISSLPEWPYWMKTNGQRGKSLGGGGGGMWAAGVWQGRWWGITWQSAPCNTGLVQNDTGNDFEYHGTGVGDQDHGTNSIRISSREPQHPVRKKTANIVKKWTNFTTAATPF